MELVFSCKCFVVWQFNNGSLNVTLTPSHHLLMRQMVDVSLSLSPCFPRQLSSSLVRLFFPLLILTALITVLSLFLRVVCHRLTLPHPHTPTPPPPPIPQRSAALGIARWDTLMKVSGPLHTGGYFHWALTCPDTLFTPPRPLRQASLKALRWPPHLTLAYQFHLSRSRRGSPKLDADELTQWNE